MVLVIELSDGLLRAPARNSQDEAATANIVAAR